MKLLLKRLFCFILILSILLPTGLFCVQAKRTDGTVDGVFYGYIQILKETDRHPNVYRAARDKNDVVYINLGDFANVIDGTVTPAYGDNTYRYSFGYWNLVVDCDLETGQLYYQTNQNRGPLGSLVYDPFLLTNCIFNSEEECWYVPLEEMLYMTFCEWNCNDNYVYIFRPPTLLDILPDVKRRSAGNPTYYDFMGDDVWEQYGNSFKYGFQAAIDEMDMDFIMSWFPQALNIKHTTAYEDSTFDATLLLLQDDSPSETNSDKVYELGSDVFSYVSDFTSNTSFVMDIGSPKEKARLIQNIAQMAGHPLTSTDITDITNFADGLNTELGYAEYLTDFIFSVAQTFWVQQYMSEALNQRLLFIQECTANETGDSFGKRLHDSATRVIDNYNIDIMDILDSLTLTNVLGVVSTTMQGIERVSSIGNAISSPLLILSVIDFTVEMSKSIPAIGNALSDAEDIHQCINLVNTATYMSNHCNSLVSNMNICSNRITQELLHNIRTSCQIEQCASMHAHTTLIKLGKVESVNTLPSMALLMMLSNSSKYDGLLLLSWDFTNIHSDEPGCVRTKIPPEYVYAGDGIFLYPVNQLTSVPVGYVGIYTNEDLLKISDDLSGTYILMEDLTFDSWVTLDDFSNHFTGILDGNGHSITINHSQKVPAGSNLYGGLFQCVSGGIVKNLHMMGSQTYTGTAGQGQFYINMVTGSVCASATEGATVFNCVNSMNITSDIDFYYTKGDNQIGGIVGRVLDSNVHISYCRNMGNITGDDEVAGIVCSALKAPIYACQNDGTVSSYYGAAGIAFESNGIITSCANRGTVKDGSMVAGILTHGGTDSRVENCINAGTVTGIGAPVLYAGGVVTVSDGRVSSCINIAEVNCAIAQELRSNASISNCYWLDNANYLYMNFDRSETNGISAENGKLTEKQMAQKQELEGIDFLSTWTLKVNMSCPYPTALLFNGQTPP